MIRKRSIRCTICKEEPEEATHKGDEVQVCDCGDIKFRRIGA